MAEFLDEEELEKIMAERGYKKLSEQNKTILVEKEDGTRVYMCKLCGEEIGGMSQIAKHFSQKHQKDRIKQSEPEEDNDKEDTIKITREPEREHRHRILTPEEEMLEEMCYVLKTQMQATPGIGSGQKTDWFVELYFRNNPVLQENPQELFKALRRHFPKTDDDAVSWIVSAVFKVKEKYQKSTSGFMSQMGHNVQMTGLMPQMNMPQPSGDNAMVTMMFTMMQQMMQQQQQFYQMLLQEAKNKVDPNAIRAQVENQYLREHLNRLEEQLDRMTEMLTDSTRSRSISPEGWKDDYTRLIAEMGDKILTLGERIIVENKKFRQTLVKYLAPRILGEGKEEFEPAGEGRTDEEILKELEEQGLIEEEV